MKSLRTLAMAAGLSAIPISTQAFESGDVVTSIKPVHSLVSAVMEGIGKPHLIVQGSDSPHTYNLRPSGAAALQRAKVVFWIGPEMESFMETSIGSLASEAHVVAFSDNTALAKLKFREAGPFESDAGDEHGEEEVHGHGGFDMHFWLDPENAKLMVRDIEETLITIDPGNMETYQSNAKTVRDKISALQQEIIAIVAPVKDRRFVVFHDGYQYFEKRFDLTAAGSITVSPEKLPGARRLKEIQEKIRMLGATCVFVEPQFKPRLVDTVTEGTEAKSGVLDPLGAGLGNGPALYFVLMRNMAQSVRDCLSRSS